MQAEELTASGRYNEAIEAYFQAAGSYFIFLGVCRTPFLLKALSLSLPLSLPLVEWGPTPPSPLEKYLEAISDSTDPTVCCPSPYPPLHF